MAGLGSGFMNLFLPIESLITEKVLSCSGPSSPKPVPRRHQKLSSSLLSGNNQLCRPKNKRECECLMLLWPLGGVLGRTATSSVVKKKMDFFFWQRTKVHPGCFPKNWLVVCSSSRHVAKVTFTLMFLVFKTYTLGEILLDVIKVFFNDFAKQRRFVR